MHIFVLAWSTTSTAIYCNTLQQIAANCNNLLAYRWRSTHACVYVTHPLPSLCMRVNHTVAYCNALQHTATHCNTLQHPATHCNTLQHTATHYINSPAYWRWSTHACASVTKLLPSLCMRMRSSSRCSIFQESAT